MNSIRIRIAYSAVILLAFIPLVQFAYLGHFSRLTKDDYVYIGKPMESSAWEAMLFFRENWNGDYTNFLLYGFLAPLGERLPSIFPSVIILLGLVCFTWFNARLLTFLRVSHYRRLSAAVLASLTLVAFFGGSYSLLAIYWFTVSVEYVLPVMILMVCLALGARAMGWAKTTRRLSMAAIAFSLLGFLNAGFSEMYLVFQSVILALIGIYALGATEKAGRRRSFILILAALLGTAGGAAAHLSAAGVSYRLSLSVLWNNPIEPVRELPLLIARTLELLPAYLTDKFAFSGFKMLAAAGLAATLALAQPARADFKQPHKLAASWLYVIGLVVQLGFLPVLWSHTSDFPYIFGRFSYSYSLALLLNIGLIIAFLAMAARPNQLVQRLDTRRGRLLYNSITLFIIGVLFVLPEARAIVANAAMYFTVTSYLMAGIYIWQLAFALAAEGDRRAIRVGLVSLASAGFTVAPLAVMIAVVSWVQGAVYDYTITPVLFPLILTGLIWGSSAGMLLRRHALLGNGNLRWCRAVVLLSLLVAIVNGWNLISAQTQKMEELAESARIWDETHQEILGLLDEDKSVVYTREFLFRSFHINRHFPLQYSYRQLTWQEKLFYGLDYEPSFG